MRRWIALALIAFFAVIIYMASINQPPEPPPPPPPLFTELRALLPLETGTRNDDADTSLAVMGFSDEVVQYLADNYGNTAINITKEHGPSGAAVIYALGMQGVAIMREQPDMFKMVVPKMGGETAAAFLIAFQNDFHYIASHKGFPLLLERVEKLSPRAKQLAIKNPGLFPSLVMAEKEVCEAVTEHPEVSLDCFAGMDYSQGPDGVLNFARMIMQYGDDAKQWVEARGLDGILLANQFSELLEISKRKRHIAPMELPVFLQILSTNQDDLHAIIAGSEENAEKVWQVFVKLHEADENLPQQPADWDELPDEKKMESQAYRGFLLNLASAEQHTMRFIYEKENDAIALIVGHWSSGGGKMLPSLLYDAYADNDPTNRDAFNHAWDALTVFPQQFPYPHENQAGVLQTLLFFAKFKDVESEWKNLAEDFYTQLKKLDYRVVPYVTELGFNEKTIVARLGKLKEQGKDALPPPESIVKQMLPGYDACRLIWVLSKGYTPTWGEAGFAVMDGGFIVMDFCTLGGGKIVTGILKGGIKEAMENFTKQGIKIVPQTVAQMRNALNYKLLCSPQNVKKFALGSARSLGSSVLLASRSLVKYPKILYIPAWYTAREWTIGMTLVTGIEKAGDFMPAVMPEEGQEPSIWAKQAVTVMGYLERLNDSIL